MGIVTTAGIFFLNNDFKLLVAHPTGHDFWSIPKGKAEKGEGNWDAALRETWEEVNVDLGLTTSVYECDTIRYKHGKKKLKPYIIFEDENRHIDSSTFELKCNSIVGPDARWNQGKPEMDDFKWVTIEEAKSILHYTQVEVLNTIEKLINKKYGKKTSQKETDEGGKTEPSQD